MPTDIRTDMGHGTHVPRHWKALVETVIMFLAGLYRCGRYPPVPKLGREKKSFVQCVFLDWFLLGYAHDAIVSDNWAFQGTAYSRTGKVPLTVRIVFIELGIYL